MLKPTVKRGLMLDFIPDEIICAEKINPNRIFKLSAKPMPKGDVIYLSTRELRLEDNWAVIFGKDLAQNHNRKFKIVVIISKILHSKRQDQLLNQGLNIFKQNCLKNLVEFAILDELPKNIGALIVDFNPVSLHPLPLPPQGEGELHTHQFYYPIYEIDSHNIVPARHISDKQEYSAATLRRKIYANIAEFMTELPQLNDCGKVIPPYMTDLENFITNKLNYYAEYKNYPEMDVTSNLSPYLHFGFISSQRVTLEVVKANASRENKETFLEELIVRKELADNFCLYGKSYNSLDGAPSWAIKSLNEHKSDIRPYLYSKNEFENAKTHDELWNKIQNGLTKAGKIHGYLRMYWAKKILEWSKSPEEALKIAIYLNDKYALDGNNPNGYVGILWSIGALHDRPFTNRFVTGKIRYMKGDKIKF